MELIFAHIRISKAPVDSRLHMKSEEAEYVDTAIRIQDMTIFICLGLSLKRLQKKFKSFQFVQAHL